MNCLEVCADGTPNNTSRFLANRVLDKRQVNSVPKKSRVVPRGDRTFNLSAQSHKRKLNAPGSTKLYVKRIS